jgi:hypothetical protein
MKTLLGFICYTCVICVICDSASAGTRSSANYSITTDTVDAGGVNAQSVNYSLHGSAVGEFGAGSSEIVTTANYTDKIAYVGQLSDMLDPITAGSRFTHGGAGTFSVNLPLVGTRGVECRSSTSLGMGNYTVVFTFGNPLTSVESVSASATGGGPAPGATGAIDGTDAHRYIVSLTNVPNAQYTTVALSNVTDSDANSSSVVSVPMGLLIGDVNSTRRTDSGDVTAVRNQTVSIPTGTPSSFRADVNVSGRIDSGDVTATRNATVTVLP